MKKFGPLKLLLEQMLYENFKEKKRKTSLVVCCPEMLCSQKSMFNALGVK